MTDTPPLPPKSEKLPWPFISTIIFSSIFGSIAGFLITWQNLKRLGKTTLSQKFFLKVGLILLASSFFLPIIFFLTGFYPLKEALGSFIIAFYPFWFQPLFSSDSLICLFFSLAFPLWFYFSQLKKEKNQATKFSWSIFVWGIIGFAVTIALITIVTSLKITPKQETTETNQQNFSLWKTYTAPEVLKISLKYPTDWEVKSEEMLNPFFESPCNAQIGCSDLYLEGGKLTEGKKLEDYGGFALTGKTPHKIIRQEKLRIGGEEAVLIEFYDPTFIGFGFDEGIVFDIAIVAHNSQVYKFLYRELGQDYKHIKESKNWQNEKTFRNILSTVKFLE